MTQTVALGPPHAIGNLLTAGFGEGQARSFKYQITPATEARVCARPSLAKGISNFDFAARFVRESLVKDFRTGNFLARQRNAVLVDSTGTAMPLAIAIGGPARAAVPVSGS